MFLKYVSIKKERKKKEERNFCIFNTERSKLRKLELRQQLHP